MTPVVHTRFSGYKCVVQLHPNMELYIQSRFYSEGFNYVEVIQRGLVTYKSIVSIDEAPEHIIQLMRDIK